MVLVHILSVDQVVEVRDARVLGARAMLEEEHAQLLVGLGQLWGDGGRELIDSLPTAHPELLA